MLCRLPPFAFAFIVHVFSADSIAQVREEITLDVQGTEPISLTRVDHDKVDIVIDGRLDEPIWSRIEPLGKLRVVEPDTLAETPHATVTRMIYADTGLYVSFDMEQPPGTLVQRHAARDETDINRDSIGMQLDASGAGRYGYWMTIALGDGQVDGALLPERQYDRDWDGAWYGATQQTDRGWSAELFVPWSQMAMPKSEGERQIGVYIRRHVAYLDQRWGWPGLTKTQPRFMSAFQPLTLRQVDPRQQWSVFPYASVTLDNIDNDKQWKTGTDVFWRPSTNFQLTATINPDFGAVESDNVVVNLTADETFFPEKRLFFQEGVGIFDTTDSKEQFGRPGLRIVNTRRIGGRPRDLDLPDDVELTRRQTLEPANIFAATKVTGQVGSFRYGAMAAFENDTDYISSDDLRYTMPGRDFGVFRVIYEDSKNAAYRGLGYITTLTAHPESDAVIHGADFHYLTTSGHWNFNGQVVYSDVDDDGDGTGITADANYQPRKGIRHEFRLSLMDDTIDVNDLGFQARNDIQDYTYRFQWNKSDLQSVRDFQLTPWARFQINGDGFRTFHGQGFSGQVTLNNLNSISGWLGYFQDQYDDRNSFGNGTFAVRSRAFADLNFRTSRAKPLSMSVRLGTRPEDLYGTSVESEIGLTWQPLDNLNLDLNVTHVDKSGWLLHQADENFTTFNGTQWQPEFSLDFYPTSRQQLSLSMQWVGIRALEDRFFVLPGGTTELVEVPDPVAESDDFSISQLSFQLRYRWQIAPLSDLFVVYTKGDRQKTDLMRYGDLFNDNWNNPLGDFLVVKLRYRLGS